MENEVINWDEQVGGDFISQAGTYTFKVVGYEEGISSNKGTPFVKFECATKEEGSIKVSFYLTEKSMWRLAKFAKAVRNTKSLGSMDTKTLCDTLVGRKFVGKVEKEQDRVDAVTGATIEGKYFELTDFKPFEE